MLIVCLVKGVPARTTKVVTVGGVLRREEMDIVLNPHDAKAVEAADFFRRRVGGKIVALSMGPDTKLSAIMKDLYTAEVYGVDEEVILSDRRMAGSDTLATAYALSLGVRKVIERHTRPLDDIMVQIRAVGDRDAVRRTARALYESNLLPNKVYSELPAVKESIVHEYVSGKVTAEDAIDLLVTVKDELSKFVVVAGVKSTDGETGSVGPQVAEGISELVDFEMPHATYVDDIDIDQENLSIDAERRIGYLVQKLRMRLPVLLTIAPEYRPREPGAGGQYSVRANNYRGKILQPLKWKAEDLGASTPRLGLSGSPTIVGPGVEVGKQPVQKIPGTSLVFLKKVEELEFGGKKYGPFDRGELADSLPDSLRANFLSEGTVGTFNVRMLMEELFI